VTTIELLTELERDGLLTFSSVRVEASATAVPAELLASLSTEIESVIIAAFDEDNLGTVHKKLSALSLRSSVRNEDDARLLQAGANTRQSGSSIASRCCGNDGALLLLGLECYKTASTILERSRGVTAIILDPDLLHAELLCKVRGVKERSVANREALNLCDVSQFDREEGAVPPHTHPLGPGSLVLLIVLDEFTNLGSIQLNSQITGIGMFVRADVLCLSRLQNSSTDGANKARNAFH